MNVTAPIRAQAARSPGAPAVILANGEAVPYQVLDGLIDAAAARLAAMGLAPGRAVALAIAGPDEFPGLVTALALARLGIASADLGVPAARLALCITEGGRAPPPGVPVLEIGRLWSGLRAGGPAAGINEDPAAVLRIMSSSGTTGRPKHAAVTHALSSARIAAAAADSDLHGPVRIVGRGLGAEGGLRSVLRALGTGAALVLTNPGDLVAASRRHGVTGLITSPVSLQAILRGMEGLPPPSLRVLEVTGAPCPTPLRTLAREKLGATLVAGAGCMECGRLASGPLLDDPAVAMRLKDGVEAQALDAAGNVLPAGTEGRLRYRATGMVPGYDDDPALTAARFQDGWFVSGDVGRVAGGCLTLTGREADLINSGGVKVAPFVIEDAMLTLPGITDAVAFGAPDAMGVEQIWAAFTATRLVPQAELTRHCVPLLGAYTPRNVLQVPRLPRTESGKVLRAMLVAYASTRVLKTARQTG